MQQQQPAGVMFHSKCRLQYASITVTSPSMPQDKRESVRDAASTLMTSCSTPQRSSANRTAVPGQAAALLMLWDGSPGGLSPSQCRDHAAQVALCGIWSPQRQSASRKQTNPQRWALSSCMVVLFSRPSSTCRCRHHDRSIVVWVALQLIVAAELCRADAAGMPPDVLAVVVPSLVTLACSAPEPHSASAATCLAAAMTGRCADAWRLHLGNLHVLTERCATSVDGLPAKATNAHLHTCYDVLRRPAQQYMMRAPCCASP